jgi:2-iminobutanoate/2-iminopropanoate deaminase
MIVNTPLQIVFTPDAPKPIGPYSQAVDTGTLLFMAGQLALDPASGLLCGATVEEQTTLVLANMQAVLHAAKLNFTNIVKTTVFLTSMDHFAAFNAVYQQALGSHAPARSVVAVSALPKGALVEIEAIACR